MWMQGRQDTRRFIEIICLSIINFLSFFLQNSTNHCQREICPPLSCPPSERISKRGECCPRCQSPRVKKEMETDCIYKQIHLRVLNLFYKKKQQIKFIEFFLFVSNFKDGDWTDSCRCRCVHGKIDCNHNQCPRDFVCPLGHKKVRIDGECCESCVPVKFWCFYPFSPLM